MDLWLLGVAVALLVCFYCINDPHTLLWSDWFWIAAIVGGMRFFLDPLTYPTPPVQRN
jgi:hypothetical protein